ncbi:conserved lipothrixviral protein [Sulfolobus islandicus filamentous virus 2]|uniref:Conserved lipothrixviral protein n=1 Tax=Sulfolobus islandicus filamentous virus 2 TaxID=1902331 RepID=A0A1D8BJ58_SIFV|nr:conserved lipothrixviral protein [Sulfolobus islandicus filamentous virus 2]
MGGVKHLNEHEEVLLLNELIKRGFKIYIKLKIGKKEVTKFATTNGLVITRTNDGMEVFDAPKNFQKREFLIKPRYPEPNPVAGSSEIYKLLSTKKEIIYREEKVIRVELINNNLILETDKGHIYILTPSALFEYPIYTW